MKLFVMRRLEQTLLLFRKRELVEISVISIGPAIINHFGNQADYYSCSLMIGLNAMEYEAAQNLIFTLGNPVVENYLRAYCHIRALSHSKCETVFPQT